MNNFYVGDRVSYTYGFVPTKFGEGVGVVIEVQKNRAARIKTDHGTHVWVLPGLYPFDTIKLLDEENE